MANERHLEILKQGVEHWNLWRENNPQVTPDLRGVELANHELELVKANLRGANLTQATLLKINLTDADLQDANLRGANLNQAILHGAALKQAKLKGANLHAADLSEATELSEEQLALTDLSRAELPTSIRHFKTGLKHIETTSQGIQQVFFTLLAACTYCWLTIAATKDASLLTNTRSSPLPILGAEIRIADFYLFAPLLLLSLYVYFHLYLQRLWEMLATLPAVFPDGETLDMKSYPRHLSGFVRTRCLFLKKTCTSGSLIQAALLVLLVWGSVPATLFWFWQSYLPRRDWGELLLIVYFALSMVIGHQFYRRANETFQDVDYPKESDAGEDCASKRLSQRCGESLKKGLMWLCEKSPKFFFRFTVLLPILLLILSFGSIYCSNDHAVCERISKFAWYKANLSREEVSAKLPSWPGHPGGNRLDLVQGAPLEGQNLRNAEASWAFLAKANLRQADLRGAFLVSANLHSSSLQEAQLGKAFLSLADLEKADLRWANLEQAQLEYTTLYEARLSVFTDCEERCLPQVNLRGAKLTRANLSKADLRGAQFDSDADLRYVDLSEARLQGARLQEARLHGATLRQAMLGEKEIRTICTTPKMLKPASCGNPPSTYTLDGADLSRADLSGADLSGADLSGAQLAGASLDGANLAGADLRKAQGLYPSMLRTTCLDEATRLPDHLKVFIALPSKPCEMWMKSH